MAGESVGSAARIGVNSTKLCFAKLLDSSRYTFADASSEMICGGLAPNFEMVDLGVQIFSLKLATWPTPEELDILLPIMGFAETPTDTFTGGSGPVSFSLVVDRVAKVHTYATCYVDKFVLRGQEGNTPLSLELDIIGTSMTEGSSFSPTAPTRTAPYPFQRCALTLLSAARPINRFAWACDYKLVRSFYNAATLSFITASAMDMYLGFSTPYTSSETGILTASIDDTNRLAGATDMALAITRGGQSTTLDFPAARWEANPPSILGKTSRLTLDQYWKAYKTAADAICTVTHDATA